MRCALYARYSSDRQSDRSIEDQVAVCETRAAAEGLSVDRRFEDRAVSGSSLFGRTGLLELMEAARRHEFEVVVAESLDRISRDQEDIAAVHKRLTFAGVRIFTLSEGWISELHIGLKGTMAALFLKDLAAKTRRGQQGRVRDGLSAGGLSYGYAVDRSGRSPTGERRIVEAQSAVVRRIFHDYASGVSPVAIVHALNAEGVPGPRGGPWRTSTLSGQKAAGNGVLRNPLYVGRMVWGRLTWMKDPQTGRRLARPGDAASVQTVRVAHLRIVDDALWEAVQDRLERLSHVVLNKRPRAVHLLSGLLRCGGCDGPYVVQERDTYGCAKRKEQGLCDNGRRIKRADLEARIALSDQLADPVVVEAYAREYLAEWAQATKARRGERQALERSLAEQQRKAARLMAKIEEDEAEGAAGKLVMAQLNTAAALIEELEAKLSESEEEAPIAVHPNFAERLGRQLQALRAVMDGPTAEAAQAREALRKLISRIVVSPDLSVDVDGRGSGPVSLTLEGPLLAILALGGRQEDCRVLLGAGTGFEPVTFRL